MTDADLCRLVAASYDATPTAVVAGDVRLVMTGDVLCIPGTREAVLADWARDLSAWEMADPILGDCHAGCLGAAYAAFAWIVRAGADPRVIVGHSLGGGIASLLAALLVDDLRKPDRLVTFGSMRSSASCIVEHTLDVVAGAHYWHHGDPVPDLPPDPFLHWRTPTMIGRDVDIWPVSVSDHLMTAYLPAMEATP